MVKKIVNQGDIIKLDLNPTKGHEQAGYRPVLIISNKIYNKKTNLVVACPITSTINGFPMHVKLDERTKTTGIIKCEQVKTLDLKARPFSYIEKVPSDVLNEVFDIIYGSIEIL